MGFEATRVRRFRQTLQRFDDDPRHIGPACGLRLLTYARQQRRPLLAIRIAQHESSGQFFHPLAQDIRHPARSCRDLIYVR